MVDTCISGARVLTPQGLLCARVLLKDGRIAALAPADAPAPDDYDYDEEYDEDVEDDGEEEAVDPNPFGSILSFLSRSRDAIGSRLHRKRADENEDYEDYDDEDEEDLEPADEEVDAPAPQIAPDTAEGASASAAEDAPADVDEMFDIPESSEPELRASDADEEEGDMLDEEDDEDTEEDDEEEDASESGLTRFLHLFIDRADDDDK